MAELEINPDDPGQHQQVDKVRIGENVEQALPQRHPRSTNRGACERELEHAAADLDFAPRSLDQQAPQVGRDNVDDVPLERLFFADSGTFPDRQLHPLLVAAALARYAAGERRGEVLDLLADYALDLAATFAHRMGRADRGPRRHRRDGRRLDNEGPRGSGAGARGRDVNDSWERRVEQVLDDALRGTEQAAGRVELNHQRASVLRAGAGYPVLYISGDGGIDRAVDPQQLDPRRRRDVSRGGDRRGRTGGAGAWRGARMGRAARMIGGGPREAAERYRAQHREPARHQRVFAAAPSHRALPRAGISSPSTFITSWISCHTSRFSPGLRRR